MKCKNKLVLFLTIILVVIIAAIVPTMNLKNEENLNNSSEIEEIFYLGNDLCITEIAPYTGKYVEDGSDESVSDILMIKVLNKGEEAIEYAVIQLQIDGQTAEFTVSALMPKEEAVLLEKHRMPYNTELDYTKAMANCVNFARYQYDLSLHEDKLKIQVLNGAVNVTNISGEDIEENVTVYYKNKEDGSFLGGIAYRISLEGGIKSGEVRQMTAKHLSKTESEILFVTITK